MKKRLIQDLRKALEEGQVVPQQARVQKARVYDVNKDTIGKLYWEERGARHEWEMNGKLREGGISVPEMHSLVPPDWFKGVWRPGGIPDWAILMEKISGAYPHRLEAYEWEVAREQYRHSLEKVLDMGIFPGDQHEHNLLFDRKAQRLYFLDVESWRFQLKGWEEETIRQGLKKGPFPLKPRFYPG